MKGTKHIIISNRFVKFEFDLNRNLTIIRGDSGTGKTTLYTLIAEHMREGDKSGINLSSPCPCVVLEESVWKIQLDNISGSIVFIDEGSKYLKSREFAEAVKQSDNYYVIFSREALHELPYSVDEIYEIKTSGKYHKLKKIYMSDPAHFYGAKKPKDAASYDIVLTEDSKSGHEFFCHYFKDKRCISSESNSNVFTLLAQNKGKRMLVMADGAAFGSEVDRVLKLQTSVDFRLCLPESFEWLILKSGLIKDRGIQDILDNPSDYIESSIHFSWENYFTSCLIERTKGTPFAYQKSRMNPVYLDKSNAERIMHEVSTDKT